MKSSVTILLVFAFMMGCNRCVVDVPPAADSVERAVVVAAYADDGVTVDGVLDEAVWQSGPSYPMALPVATVEGGAMLEGPGTVRLAWDEKYLYLAAELTDDDVVAEGESDQLHHYKLGDVLELFVKPENSTWYWELYVTPTGLKTSFWFPGRGRLGLPSGFEHDIPGMVVAAKVQGTLNDWQDSDCGWTAEMAVPLAELTARGEPWGPGADWTVLVGRYNYSRYLTSGPELTAVPLLPKASYHDLPSYAELRLAPPAEKSAD